MQPRYIPQLILIFLGCLCTCFFISCAKTEKQSLNIPAGFATHTLKEFARQAKVEIIFDPQSVYGVKTHSVDGDYDPHSALQIMLEDTPLRVDYDDETGAYAIIRVGFSGKFNRTLFIDTKQKYTYAYIRHKNP